jgi:hypothetical protein
VLTSRELLVHARNSDNAKRWKEAIHKVMESKGQDFVESKRFNSFAPVRSNVKAHW